MKTRVLMVASGAFAACLAGCLESDRLDQSTTEQPVINDPTRTNYNLGVLVLKFIPTADGVNIDTSVTGDVFGSVAAMRTKTDLITANLVNLLSAGSAYHNFSNQVYAPGPAHVCVLEWNGSTWTNQVCTNWI